MNPPDMRLFEDNLRNTVESVLERVEGVALGEQHEYGVKTPE